jgi:hypothetical protein
MPPGDRLNHVRAGAGEPNVLPSFGRTPAVPEGVAPTPQALLGVDAA